MLTILLAGFEMFCVTNIAQFAWTIIIIIIILSFISRSTFIHIIYIYFHILYKVLRCVSNNIEVLNVLIKILFPLLCYILFRFNLISVKFCSSRNYIVTFGEFMLCMSVWVWVCLETVLYIVTASILNRKLWWIKSIIFEQNCND